MRLILVSLFFLLTGFADPMYPHSPDRIYSYSVTTGTIVNKWQDLGATVEYQYQHADDISFTTNLVTGTTSSPNFDITSLSGGATKYIRVRAKDTGYSYSNWSNFVTTTTLISDPVGWYSIEGIESGVDNNYADMTSERVTTLRNISATGTGPDFDYLSGGTNGIGIQHNSPSRPSVYGSVSASYYENSTGITLTGDFCVAMLVEPPSAASLCALLDSNGNTTHARVQTTKTNVQIRINSTNYALFTKGQIPINVPVSIVFKREGTNAAVSIDGGYTFGPSTTVSTADVLFNRFFANSSGGNNNVTSFNMVAFFDDVLSGDQLLPFFEPTKQPNWWFHNEDQDPTVTISGSWGTLTNGSPTDAVSIQDNGSKSWKKVWSKGDYTFLMATKVNTSPTYSDQLLYTYNHNTGQYSTSPVLLPHYVASDDIHNQHSLLVWDNTIWTLGMNDHYSATLQFTNVKIRRFNNNYDLTRFTDKTPIENGIPPYSWSQRNYINAVALGSRVCVLAQKWSGAFAHGLSIFWSDDKMNSWKTVQPFVTTSPTWAYPYLLNTGKPNEFAFLCLTLNSSNNKYTALSLIRTDDFKTFWNWDKTFSWEPNPNSLINLTTIEANCAFKTTTSATEKNAPLGNAFIDENGLFYAIHGDGENTNWQVTYSTNPGFTSVLVDFPSAQNVVLPPSGPGTDFNRAAPLVFKTGATSYTVLAECDPNSDGLYRVGKFTTTDTFTSEMTFDSYVSTDNTRKHWNIQPDFNYHFNDHAMVMGTSVNSASTAAVPWFYVIK